MKIKTLLASAPGLFQSPGLFPSVLLIAALYLLLRRARGGMWRLALLALPGTLVHELVHWIVGWLLFAKPAGLSLRPKRAANGWVLGSVSFRGIGLFNGAFVALAPLLLLPLAWITLGELALPAWADRRWGRWLGAGYLTATLLFSALPSGQDLREGSRSLLFYGILGGVGWLLSVFALRGWFP